MAIENWKLIKNKPQEKVWANQKLNRRIISAKGDKSWQVFIEKNEGKIASDDSYLPNATISALLSKEDAIKKAKEYMRSH